MKKEFRMWNLKSKQYPWTVNIENDNRMKETLLFESFTDFETFWRFDKDYFIELNKRRYNTFTYDFRVGNQVFKDIQDFKFKDFGFVSWWALWLQKGNCVSFYLDYFGNCPCVLIVNSYNKKKDEK